MPEGGRPGPGGGIALVSELCGLAATGTDERSGAGSQLCQVAVIEHGQIGLYRGRAPSPPFAAQRGDGLGVWRSAMLPLSLAGEN
jgi:hypothetical protein